MTPTKMFRIQASEDITHALLIINASAAQYKNSLRSFLGDGKKSGLGRDPERTIWYYKSSLENCGLGT